MAADPTSKKKHVLRPLPSVDMALLPEELRARRMRRFVLGGLLGAAVLAAILVWAGRTMIPQTTRWFQERFGSGVEIEPEEPIPGWITPIETPNTSDAGIAQATDAAAQEALFRSCLLYTSPSPRDRQKSRMPSSA